VYKNGHLVRDGAGGMARVASDAPAVKFNPGTRIDIASCSKLLTAITTLKELDRAKLKPTELIHKHLPKSWAVHPSIKTITFEQLLAHRSGLKPKGDKSRELGKANVYLKETMKAGVSDPEKKFDYENMNFALCRVLVSYVRDRERMEKTEGDPKKFDRAVADCFVGLMRSDVTIPAGLSDKISLDTWDATPQNPGTLSYDFANPKDGLANQDSTLVCGAGGWWMNAKELAAVVSALDRGKLLSPALTATQRDKRLGMFGVAGRLGTYYWHNGSGGGAKTSKANFMMFPSGVQVAVVVNSGSNTFGDQKKLITKAFDDACLQADLTVKAFKPGDAKYDGDVLTVPFTMTVANTGKGDTDARCFAGVEYKGKVVWVGSVPELKPNGTKVLNGTVKIKDPKRELIGKTIFLSGVADPWVQAADTNVPDYATIRESDEKNNESQRVAVKVPRAIPSTSGGLVPMTRK
jgi:Beta-lactamase